MTMTIPTSKTSLFALPDSLKLLLTKLFPPSFASLILRFALAVPFFKSGLTKWDGFLAFLTRHCCCLPKNSSCTFSAKPMTTRFPALMAWGSSIGEIILPILLVLGLFTRLSAFGILIMTAMIQLTIPDGWANFHLPWAAMAIAIIVIGPGKSRWMRCSGGHERKRRRIAAPPSA